MSKSRLERIHAQGLDFTDIVRQPELFDFSKIKVGVKDLNDAVYVLGDLTKANKNLATKEKVLKAINDCDYVTMRKISNYFFRVSGIYSRLVRYAAYLYRYDWLVTPYMRGGEDFKNNQKSSKKIIEQFYKVLDYLDNCEIKRILGEIALKVILNGCYYGYIVQQSDRMVLQELPLKYCRSRYNVGNHPAIEFNMKYFDDAFMDESQRKRILKLFPPEFEKGYKLYKAGKLVPDFFGDSNGWYLLDIDAAIKFNINNTDYPFFISVIPAIIDLDAAQELDRKKMQQQLLKIIVQKMPFDKNGDPVFDTDEAKALHNNAVAMLGRAIGIDVLTTFADVEVEDMADNRTSTTSDELEKVERTVFNEAGVSQKQFNTDGNIALDRSISNDEASLYNLVLQFENFLNGLLKPFNKNKKMTFKVQILTTTIYNYKDMAKLFKEQTQLGYSKMLPQIALGQTQSAVLANAMFENDILDLVNVFIPPVMSSVMSSDVLDRSGKNQQTDGGASKTSTGQTKDSDGAGRKEKADNEKSEKTIQNRESMS